LSALTKILIVLQLVFSLVCSVLLVLMVSRAENYKVTNAGLQAANVGQGAALTKALMDRDAALASNSSLTEKLNAATANLSRTMATASSDSSKAEQERLDLQNKLAAMTAQVQALTASNSTQASSLAAKDAELEKLRPQVADLMTKYNEISRAKMEDDNQLRAAAQSIRKLQEIIANQPTAGAGGGGAGAIAPIGSGDQIQTISSAAPAAGRVNGTVTDVAQSSGRTLIELPLGTRDGIQVGTKVYVYRSTGYVGDASVQRVTPEQSVAVVVSTKAGETVQKGDMVSTTGQ
jgi:hypothetical protein